MTRDQASGKTEIAPSPGGSTTDNRCKTQVKIWRRTLGAVGPEPIGIRLLAADPYSAHAQALGPT